MLFGCVERHIADTACRPCRPAFPAAATANVQASKVIRSKRAVEKPQTELEPAAPDASEAADAVAELAYAALASCRGGGSSLTMALPVLPMPLPGVPAGDPAAAMQLMALQQQAGAAAAQQQQQQHELRSVPAAAAAAAGTTGKKRRGRPPKHARVEEPEYEPPGAKRVKAERAASLPPQTIDQLDLDVRWGSGRGIGLSDKSLCGGPQSYCRPLCAHGLLGGMWSISPPSCSGWSQFVRPHGYSAYPPADTCFKHCRRTRRSTCRREWCGLIVGGAVYAASVAARVCQAAEDPERLCGLRDPEFWCNPSAECGVCSPVTHLNRPSFAPNSPARRAPGGGSPMTRLRLRRLSRLWWLRTVGKSATRRPCPKSCSLG